MNEKRSMKASLKILIGFLGTAAVCAALYFLRIPGPENILLTLVAILAFFGGFAAGVPAGLAAAAYAFLTDSETGHLFTYTQESLNGLIVFSSCVLLLVLLLGILRIRSGQKSRDLAEANRKVELLTGQDELTALPNRRSLDDLLQKEYVAAIRTEEPLSLALADLDYFKQYNDANGHIAGDECLKRVADAIRQEAEHSGYRAARFGGEEFAVIMPNVDETRAGIFAHRIKDDVEALKLPHGASPVAGVVTVSIGVASAVAKRRTDKGSLVENADRALARAKENGRNRVELFSEPAPPAAEPAPAEPEKTNSEQE